ncbi:hypothetical protein [Sciscionella sediminilitoris]|uniref:baeRF2 domain-containing protein n=1 Tax=Sciscionella sediminilitoris TaxID=1445613 RepID=UPI0012E0D7A9|nr:hypothetical protein [Sciscionella sp. SE31]
MYESEGPFLTVYLAGGSPDENAAEHVWLRWRALHEQVADTADTDSLDAVERAVEAQQPGSIQADGRVLVGAGGQVLLDEAVDASQGGGDTVRWGPEPYLGAYVRESAKTTRILLVVADQHSADIHRLVVAAEQELADVGASEVRGAAGNKVHHPRGGQLAHARIQRHADENRARNAEEIAALIDTRVEQFRPSIVLLAGAVEARAELRSRVGARAAVLLAETDRGGKDVNASEESLTEELLRIAEEHESAERAELAERLDAGLAHQTAVQGAGPVGEAASEGAVDMLLLDEHDTGVDEASLLRECALTDAGVGLLPEETVVRDSVAALLRYARS